MLLKEALTGIRLMELDPKFRCVRRHTRGAGKYRNNSVSDIVSKNTVYRGVVPA